MFCDECGCPAPNDREQCAWCGAYLQLSAPVAFVLTETADRFEWLADDTVVAAASVVHGLWRIVDSRDRHVVTLMPVDPGDAHPSGTVLVGPEARVLGTVVHGEDDGSRTGVSVRDERNRSVLVLRGDGPNGSHVVDRSGEVVAVSSWGDDDGVTDVLVTANGSRQPLALVFGLLLATELERQPGRQQA